MSLWAEFPQDGEREGWHALCEDLFALLVQVMTDNDDNRAFFAEEHRVDHLIGQLDQSDQVLAVSRIYRAWQKILNFRSCLSALSATMRTCCR